MVEESRSTLSFRSNLQPLTAEDSGTGWDLVHSAVRDPFALEIMDKNGIILNASQRQQYEYASVHCAYAFPDDYPWGSVIGPDGQETIKCKCLNTQCRYFSKCRPDFDEEELRILEENMSVAGQALEFSRKSDIRDALKSNGEKTVAEATTPDSGEIEETVETAATEPEEPIDNKTRQEPETKHTDSKPQTAPEKKVREKAGFESFVVADQNNLIYADIGERVVVNAGPGTGKTWTLIEKIKYLMSLEDADPEGIMILCFSRAAVEVIEQRLQSAADSGEIGYEYANLDVRTFDSFCTYVISWAMESFPEILPKRYSLEGQDYDARIITAINVLRSKTDTLAQYSHLIIDEVQDLVGCRAELVLQMLRILPEDCGFTLLGDACQALYDWQTDDSHDMMSSEKFYKQLFKEYPEINYWTFTENHRQSGVLSEIAVPYREAILTGTPESRNKIVSDILASVQNASIDLKRVSPAEIEKFRAGGTLGILARTNGQALKISELLRNADVAHSLQKPASEASLQPWIANTLMNYPNETVNESMFVPVFLSSNPGRSPEEAKDAWKALISTQNDDGKTRFEVAELLTGLLRNGRDKALFIVNNPDVPITVSNIHRSKGREYDAVLVLEDVLVPQGASEENVQEHKVRYVAITRPRRKLSDVSMKPQYIYIDGSSRRCYQASISRNRNKYLTHVEIGLPGDINSRSFAVSAERQKFIADFLEPGTRLKLLKLPPEGPIVQYKIVLEENENICLGTTGTSFHYGLKKAMQRIWDRNSDIDYRYYGNIFGDIYVEDIITCVATADPKMAGAKVFGNMAVWKGFSVSGFARYEKDLY